MESLVKTELSRLSERNGVACRIAMEIPCKKEMEFAGRNQINPSCSWSCLNGIAHKTPPRKAFRNAVENVHETFKKRCSRSWSCLNGGIYHEIRPQIYLHINLHVQETLPQIARVLTTSLGLGCLRSCLSESMESLLINKNSCSLLVLVVDGIACFWEIWRVPVPGGPISA